MVSVAQGDYDIFKGRMQGDLPVRKKWKSSAH